MAGSSDPYRHFRLDLEQQRKRAKELLSAARDGDAEACARIRAAAIPGRASDAPKLADAQRAIARELRCASWAELKQHIAAMTRARAALVDMTASVPAAPRSAEIPRAASWPAETPTARYFPTARPDADLKTLHVRCGSDIRETLRRAGFGGDFYEHSYPYLIGPVSEGPDCLEQRARFLVASYGDDMSLELDRVLADLHDNEAEMHGSAAYERVVIWSERDCYDQLVLVRLLGHYATQGRPQRLELVNLGEFPGSVRFIGLGQLPPEALRLLWSTRAEAGPAELELGLESWRALASPDPRRLAAIARTGTPALPLLAAALERHLQELPAVTTGLSLTEAIVLERLAREDASLQTLFVELTSELDPLPGQGDLQLRDRVLAMERASRPLFVRRPGSDARGRSRPPWTDVLSLTAAGRAVLAGEIDYLSLGPPGRWVGGVEIGPGRHDWRWDEAARDVALSSERRH
jgi:hypothetical protein